jgi:ATP-dependent DNA helicase DinG
MFLQDLSDIFAPDGPLAAAAPNYRVRQAQLELAQAIEQARQDRAVLVAEAGTGTGKTWAYLVPSFLGGGKVLVSTGTRTLQDQLFRRDLPKLRKALALPVAAALLKGRSNYVCHYHLNRVLADDRALKSRTEVAQLRRIQEFTRQTSTGDKADLASVPENADIWNRVSSTRENCLGQDCPNVRDCFLLKARRQAQEADVVVVNHALFMADLALRQEGITDLLPEADMVVFDEAHQLPDIATQFLGTSISTHQLLDLAKTTEAAGLAQAREATNWGETCRAIEQATRELRLAAAAVDKMPGRRATYQAIPNAADFDAAVTALLAVLDKAAECLKVVAPKHPDLDAALKTCLQLRARLFQWSQPDRDGNNALAPQGDDGQPGAAANVRWVELGIHSMRLHSAPLSVAEIFSRYRRDDQTWVFTSATLSVHGKFDYFVRQLGLDEATTQRWESPFDYTAQGILYVPASMPAPASPAFCDSFVQALLPVLLASTGGALVLCTTLRAVDRIATLLEDEFDAQKVDRTVLRQGESSRAALLERFRAAKNAVLVGSASFWEGVDVPGDALTLVAIDKLPFAPPDDPVLEARMKQCRDRGGNPFSEFQLPEAALALKQGAGRLIRTEDDWGVLMVGDARLVDKPYGKVLWRGLPPFSRTRDQAAVVAFCRGRQAGDAPHGAPFSVNRP